MAREERADSILGGTDEFIANVDVVLYKRDKRSVSPANGPLVGKLEEAVERERRHQEPGGWRARLGGVERLRRLSFRH